MERTTALQQAKALSIDDRIWLVQALWDSISAEPEQQKLTEAQQQELSRRLTDHHINPQSVVSWEESSHSCNTSVARLLCCSKDFIYHQKSHGVTEIRLICLIYMQHEYKDSYSGDQP